MKEALLRKRYGIPAALLLALLFSGTALAWYSLNTISTETTVEESISTTENTVFTTTMYPGESNTWKFDITNSADVDYSIKADLTYSAPDGVSITKFKVDGTNETTDLTDDGSATFNISANATLSCRLTVKATKDAATGDVSVKLDFSRQ